MGCPTQKPGYYYRPVRFWNEVNSRLRNGYHNNAEALSVDNGCCILMGNNKAAAELTYIADGVTNSLLCRAAKDEAKLLASPCHREGDTTWGFCFCHCHSLSSSFNSLSAFFISYNVLDDLRVP